jgi:hypothetical protein
MSNKARPCDLESLYAQRDESVSTLLWVLEGLLADRAVAQALPSDDLQVMLREVRNAEDQIILALALVDSPAPGTH